MDWVLCRKLGEGLLTYVPGVNQLANRVSGGSDDARYCYSVWLRHLVCLGQAGLPTNPKSVAELGPGDSLGTGLCAILTGANDYFGCDVRSYANTERNLAVLEQLITLFKQRTPIPGPNEYPLAKPMLADYAFPSAILTESRLEQALSEPRLDRIRAALSNESAENEIQIRYVAPWYDAGLLPPNSVDMVFSQAVLEHVDDLEQTYRTLRSWLRPGGVSSHQIDFNCHHYASQWNGHWTYSKQTWSIIRGRRTYAINRQPVSTHRELLERNGFEIRFERPFPAESRLGRHELAPEFRHLTDEDLTTRSALIQAVKPASVAQTSVAS